MKRVLKLSFAQPFEKSLLVAICLGAFLSIIVLSCSSKKPARPNSQPVTFGTIVHKVCSADTTQSYEVYRPVSSPAQKKMPVLYVFDSHGDGKLAVAHFREAAERFGYIVVGSDNSKNGLQTLDHTLDILINDVAHELPIDPNRQYAAGFSGGGRVASYLASKTGNIKGVITCGAGFDPGSAISKFDIYAIAGKADFNYGEVMALNQQLANTNWRFMATAFDGGHAWPPAVNLTRAVLWFQLNAMRDGLIDKDKDALEQELDSINIRCDRFLANQQFMQAANECNQGIAFLNDLVHTKKLNKKLKEIKLQDGYTQELRKAEQLQYMEQRLREGYIQAFANQDLPWWKKEIASLYDKTKLEKDPAMVQMLKRIKGFLGIVCYSYTSKAIAGNNLDLASKSIGIYELVETENPDCFFYKACLMDKTHHYKEASDDLTKAINLGFKDMGKARASLSAKTLQLAAIK